MLGKQKVEKHRRKPVYDVKLLHCLIDILQDIVLTVWGKRNNDQLTRY